MKRGPQPVVDPVDRLFAGILLHAAIRRGASRQELIDLAVRYKRLDVVRAVAEENER